MAFADLSAYKTAINNAGAQYLTRSKQSGSGGTGRLSSWWLSTPELSSSPALAPTTMVAADVTTVGCIGQQNASGSLYVAAVSMADYANNNQTGISMPGTVMLCDRLVHCGGLDATVTTANTLAAASLPRYTSGVGVWAAIELYNTIGSTATTATISYTNTTPTSGQTSQAVILGGSGRTNSGTFLPLPLAAGDTGVLSVQSVTLAGSTLTAGSYGVTLFKPLLMLPITGTGDCWQRNALNGGLGGLPVIQPNACLWWVGCGPSTTNAGFFNYSIQFADA